MLVEDYFGHWLQVLDRRKVTHMNNFLSTLHKVKNCLLKGEFWPEKIIFDNTLESQVKQ